LELIAFGEAGCFGAADTAELLEYCARLLDLYAARAAESLGVDVRAVRALLGVWILGAADAAGLLDAADAAGSLGIGYCARLLSCCDAGVLREGPLAYWVLGAAIAAR
jgi:hypothetical protein